MKTKKNFIALLFSLIFFGGLLSGEASSQELIPNLDKLNKSIFDQNLSVLNQNTENQTSTPADLQTIFDQLISKAREKGTVKVIIGLRLADYQPDAELGSLAQFKQRLEIKERQTSVLNRINNFTVSNTKEFEYIPFIALEISADALASLRDSSDIISIQEDKPVPALLLESVPLIGAPAAWNMGFTGQGRTVAILDSGVDKFHPFFNGRIVSEGCYSTPSSTTVSVCPGGVAQSTAVNSGLNCDVNQIEGCSHGTHVAGIAAGGNPQINGAGVAKNAGIIAMQVFTVFFGTDCGSNPSPCISSFPSDQIKALERVYALRTTFNIDAVNMSLGGGQYFNYCDTENAAQKAAIDNLRSANIATVIASGNSSYTNSLSSPACISTAISVGSTHDGSVAPVDTVSSFSNSALFLNLLAPGEQILSSEPGGVYNNSQGTSQAAPHVAGAWAVLKQRYPNDTVAQILNRLTYSGVPVLDSRNSITKPRIRVDLALNTPNTNPCNTISPINPGQNVSGSLSTADCLTPLGSRTDIYSFSGTQGQGITISESSTAFDSYLYLFKADGSVLAQDDDGGGGTNSRIPAGSGFFQLPATGTYYIYATSFEGNRFGNYNLSLTSNTPTCSFTVSSGGQAFGAGGGNHSFNVAAGTGCSWTAQSNAAWLTITSGGSGSGNGTVNYSVAANTSATARSAAITAGGQIHTVTQSGATVTVPNRRMFDFDGDNKTDLGIFRSSLGEWWYLRSGDSSNRAFQFGSPADKIVPADYTGDGKTDVAFFRPSTGEWFILRSEDSSFYSFPFGASSDIPAPADFDGDGKSDPAVFRPSTATWYIIRSSDGGTTIAQFGASGDLPVAADYDGDSKADLAIFRPSDGSWWLNRTQAGLIVTNFGSSTDKTVQADYTGDGRADVAFFRPSSGEWFILRSENFSFYSAPFGASGDIPVPGDYDGDGKADLGVFRPSNATWYINGTTGSTQISQFGAASDRPVPNAFVR